MNLGEALQEHTRRINLEHVNREGVYYHRCRACQAEWEAEKPEGPVNPDWWRCPNGCNVRAAEVKIPKVRIRRHRP